MNRPLITVIIPVYNSPDIYLTIDSVLQQDYPRIQLIIVDDASASFSKKEVESYIQLNNMGNLESLLILVNSQNRGTVYSMNLALKHSLGKYQFNLAGDDAFYDNRVLTDWVDAFIKTKALVMTAKRAVYDERLEVCMRIEPTAQEIKNIQTLPTQALFERIAAVNFIFGCCTARSAECIRKYGLYDESYRLIEDHPMNLRLLREGEQIMFFDRIVVKWRGGGSSSPWRFNTAYAGDAERVIYRDVLPYTKHPVYMRWRYYAWKREHRLCGQRARQLKKYGQSKLARILIHFAFYIRRPFRTLWRAAIRIYGRIRKAFQKHTE